MSGMLHIVQVITTVSTLRTRLERIMQPENLDRVQGR
jgi:hypothetical protein